MSPVKARDIVNLSVNKDGSVEFYSFGSDEGWAPAGENEKHWHLPYPVTKEKATAFLDQLGYTLLCQLEYDNCQDYVYILPEVKE